MPSRNQGQGGMEASPLIPSFPRRGERGSAAISALGSSREKCGVSLERAALSRRSGKPRCVNNTALCPLCRQPGTSQGRAAAAEASVGVQRKPLVLQSAPCEGHVWMDARGQQAGSDVCLTGSGCNELLRGTASSFPGLGEGKGQAEVPWVCCSKRSLSPSPASQGT